MKTNKFKVLLCCYAMGVAGCNKIGNPSYMDGGGDRKDGKKQEEEASFSVEQSGSNAIVLERSTIDHNKMLEDTLRGMKEDADLAEEIARDKEKDVERAIKRASGAKVTAERLRKTADDTEKSRRELRSGDASTSSGVTRKSVDDKEKESRVGLGPGGDTL